MHKMAMSSHFLFYIYTIFNTSTNEGLQRSSGQQG